MYKMNLKFYWNYFHLMSMYTVSNNKCIQINKCMKHWHYIYMPTEGYAICILQTIYTISVYKMYVHWHNLHANKTL